MLPRAWLGTSDPGWSPQRVTSVREPLSPPPGFPPSPFPSTRLQRRLANITQGPASFGLHQAVPKRPGARKEMWVDTRRLGRGFTCHRAAAGEDGRKQPAPPAAAAPGPPWPDSEDATAAPSGPLRPRCRALDTHAGPSLPQLPDRLRGPGRAPGPGQGHGPVRETPRRPQPQEPPSPGGPESPRPPSPGPLGRPLPARAASTEPRGRAEACAPGGRGASRRSCREPGRSLRAARGAAKG